MQKLFAKVAVSSAVLSIDKLYDYTVPTEFEEKVSVGMRVAVPFGKGNKKAEGFIFALYKGEPCDKYKTLLTVYNDCAFLSPEDIKIANFLKNRYLCTLFEAANALMPPGVWSDRADVYFKSNKSLSDALEIYGKSKVKRQIISLLYSENKSFSASDINKLLSIDNAEIHLRQLVKAGYADFEHRLSKTAADKFIKTVSPLMHYDEAVKLIPNGKLGEKRKEVLKVLCEEGEMPEKELCYLTGAGVSLISNLEKNGFLKIFSAETYRRPEIKSTYNKREITLNDEQNDIYEKITALMDETPKAALLYGVTGSGKTEIYIKLIKSVLSKGKSAVLTVPEIALTPQTVRRFYSYFGDDVAIIHSGLTQTQRYDEYKRMKNGQAHIAIGTRTAVFAPLKDIGIIIIDEEQEYTYKSENAPRYSADEVAKYRALNHNCLVLLGSATPSVSTMHSAKSGKISLLRLDKRFNFTPLPKTYISDMRGKLLKGAPSCLGDELLKEMEINLKNKEKTILFLNRRGAAHRVVCVDCGYTPSCINCNVSLVYHSKNHRLLCHHCGYSVPGINVCPNCGSLHIKHEGIGTQKVEEEIKNRFPAASVLRMDADTVVGRTTHEKILDDFGAGDADILLGTQMVAKGLDFEKVTLVGVVDCDGLLSSADFRAQERAFSLITQVIGRAGRREKQGRAVIQTYSPSNPVIISAANQDYDTFYEYEIKTRKALNVPPFCDIFNFTLTGKSEDYTLKAAFALSATIVKAFKEKGINTNVLGPIPAVISKINGKYRFNVSYRCNNDSYSRTFALSLLSAYLKTSYSKNCSVSFDVNNFA